MTGVTRPRGPLPARVYWTRRLLVTLVALALVFGVARLLGGGTGGADPEARPVGASPTGVSTSGSATSTGARPTTGLTTGPTTGPTTGAATPAATGGAAAPLPQPTGACAGADVVAVPSVGRPAYAANPILIATTLRTRTSPACTWTVSAASLVLKVTRPTTLPDGSPGTDSVWSTQECRGAVPKQAVVLRRDTPVTVTVVWNGRRSDSTCSTAPTWADDGYYRVAAAAFGGNPASAGFRLGIAPRATITATPTPTPTATASGSPRAGRTATPGATAGRSATPSATASPAPSRTPSARATGSPSPSGR